MDEDRSIPPTATADDSGIIDLRALSAQVAAQRAATGRASLPELYAAPSWAPPAPVAIPARARSRWASAAIAVSATLAVSMVAFAAVPALIARTMREPAPVAAVPAPATPVVTETTEIEPVVVQPETPSQEPIETTSRPAIVDAPTRPRRASVPTATRPAPALETVAATPAPATGIDSDIDRLLETALGGARPDATPTETLPATPSQRDVMAALRGLERQVVMCRGGDGAIAATRVVIDGATGRVQSVRVTGVDAAAGACVSDLVETATFPRFAQDTFAVTFPYRL